MEHRYSKRVPVNINSLIHSRNATDIPGKIKNIGYDGVFIESTSIAFPKGSTVEVEFTLDRGTEFRLPAMVIHSSESGMGLMFRQHDLRSSSYIKRLIRRAQSHVV